MLHSYGSDKELVRALLQAQTTKKDQFTVYSRVKTNDLSIQMKTMPIKFAFSCGKFFLQTGRFWRKNFSVALKTSKRDSGMFYQGLTENEPRMTWLNLFLDDFNRKSRLINKKHEFFEVSHGSYQPLNFSQFLCCDHEWT